MNTASRYYKINFDLSSSKKGYMEKYSSPKGKVDDTMESDIINFAYKLKPKHIKVPRVLEVGVYTGRVHKKLKKFFSNITVSDVSVNILKKYNNKKFILNLSKKKKIIVPKFDFIFSLGHQISFSNNILNAIKTLTNLLNHNGFLVFDIWNKDCSDYFDPKVYRIEKMSKEQILKILDNHKLKLIKFSQGQKLFYTFNLIWRVFNFLIPRKIFIRLLVFFELLLKDLEAKKAQNLYFVIQKNNK